jgi:hypothetical protein
MINLKHLLTEQVEPKQKVQEASDHVRSGLEKVFSAGEKVISYRRVENVGLGYIRSVSEAIKCAVHESRPLAAKYGYKDDEVNEKFIKEENDFSKLSAENPEHSMAKVGPGESPHDETDMSNPEEKREVQIAREILVVIDSPGMDRVMETEKGKLRQLAQQLLQMHGAK